MGGPPQQMGGPPRPGMGPGAGMGYPQQQRQKLDPDSIPSPIEVMQNDQSLFDDQPFTTDKGAVPPACTTKIKRLFHEKTIDPSSGVTKVILKRFSNVVFIIISGDAFISNT